MQFSYPVLFTNNLLTQFPDALQRTNFPIGPTTKLLPVVDTGLCADKTFLPRLRAALKAVTAAFAVRPQPPVLIPGGETAKTNPLHLQALYTAIHRANLCRHSYLLVLGGGAVLDVAGYAAATAHRGIRLLRVPTTVLSQADSGVGVKNAINAFSRKNFLGTFAPPHAVFNDRRLLRTLSDRDRRAGMAEAVKVAIIKDATFFRWLQKNAPALAAGDEPATSRLIYRSAALHLNHIAKGGDPFEHGSARPLDFGHWAAHKLEELTNHNLRHGEAVAIGMALDVTYATEIGRLPPGIADQLISLLRQLQLPIAIPQNISTTDLLSGIEEFRQHLGGRLSITLPTAIGKCAEIHSIDIKRMRKCINKSQRREPGRVAPVRASRPGS